MKLGAFDYLLKPLELPQFRHVVRRALEISRLMHVPALVPADEPTDDRADVLVGRCPAMQAVYKAIGRVAPQDVTVLILGESGTGKELVARAIYQHSRRSTGPFLAINCAAIPETSCWRASCSATKRARSPGPIGGASANSSNATAAPSSWTKSATCRSYAEQDPAPASGTTLSSDSAATRRFRPTSA